MRRLKYFLVMTLVFLTPRLTVPASEGSNMPSLEQLFRSGQLDTFKIEHGVERSDLAAQYILLKAEEAMGQGLYTEAVTLGEAAAHFSPASPIPHFFLSKAYWFKKDEIFNALSHSLTALDLVMGDFWFLYFILGMLFLLFLFGVFFSIATFLLYSFVSYSPLWIHQAVEGSGGTLYPISAGFLLTTLLFAPLILGIPVLWFFLFCFLFFWGFYSRAEKEIVMVLLAGIGGAAWILPFLLAFFTAKDSTLLSQMVRNHQHDFFWSPPILETGEIDWKASVIRASYETQEKNYQRAEALYREALSKQPQSAMILNNLGNLSFYAQEYPKAIEYYQQALRVFPKLVSAHYNMGQTYREMLSFEDGNRKYLEAKSINREEAEYYAKKTAIYPTYPMIEVTFTKADLLNELLKLSEMHEKAGNEIWQGWAGRVTLKRAPLLAFLWFFLLGFSSLLLKQFYTATFCLSCHKAICKRCQQSVFGYRVCGTCGAEFKTVRKRSDLPLLEEKGRKIPWRFYPFFLLPGGGHLVVGKARLGFLLLILFYFFIGYAWLGETFFSSTQWHLNSGRGIWVPFSLFILYLLSTLDLARIWSHRPWP